MPTVKQLLKEVLRVQLQQLLKKQMQLGIEEATRMQMAIIICLGQQLVLTAPFTPKLMVVIA